MIANRTITPQALAGDDELQRLRGLESEVCDLANMATILGIVQEDISGARTVRETGQVELLLTAVQEDALNFAIANLITMARQMRVKFYSAVG